MKPVLFEIPLPGGGHIPIHGYGLMIVIGFLLGAFVADREARRRGLPDFMYDLGLVMLLCGILGGRIFFYVQYYDEKFAGGSLLEFFEIWKGGLVFYGGAIGGLLGGVAYCLRKRLPLPDCMDMAAIAVPIGMAFGRIGCYLNGCCFGKTCDPGFSLGVVFPQKSNAQDTHLARGLIEDPSALPLPVHPVQLYQAAHDFLMFGLVFAYLRRPEAPRGAGMPLLFVLYGVGRFLLEGFRGDHEVTRTGWTVSQNLSLTLLVAFGSLLILLLVRAPFGFREPPRFLPKTS